jgi:hypothetical protein
VVNPTLGDGGPSSARLTRRHPARRWKEIS